MFHCFIVNHCFIGKLSYSLRHLCPRSQILSPTGTPRQTLPCGGLLTNFPSWHRDFSAKKLGMEPRKVGLGYPLVIKYGNGKSTINRAFQRKITDQWSVFQQASRGYFLQGNFPLRPQSLTKIDKPNVGFTHFQHHMDHTEDATSQARVRSMARKMSEPNCRGREGR